jgi:2',3'-cyclic-nucleotide 2'-phosphodiesterase (5'-nucleotidase family)
MFFPSQLSRQFKGAQMIDALNLLDGDAKAFDERMFATFGNHEFEKSKTTHASMVRDLVRESGFSWVSSNVEFARNADGQPLVDAPNLRREVLVEANGLRVGIFGLTTDILVPEYVSAITDPVDAARRMAAELRARGADVVIGLTHLDMATDRRILETLGADGPDVIFGGHEHFRQSAKVDGRLAIKADADARTATVAQVSVSDGNPPVVNVSYDFRKLDTTVAEDGKVKARVDDWLGRYAQAYCSARELSAGCLDEPLGRTTVKLVAEELQIRSIETNLGDFVADQALAAFRDRGAQVAFVNSGSLRLNQDLPAGTMLTRNHLAQLFAYASPMHLLRIKGATLQRVADKAVTGWPGSGRWLQIAGFAFRHDDNAGTATNLTLLTPDGPRPVDPQETLLAVVPDYLVNPNAGDQDGYTMLDPDMIVATSGTPPDLADIVTAALKASGAGGIAPRAEGRICNPETTGHEGCLAVGH